MSTATVLGNALPYQSDARDERGLLLASAPFYRVRPTKSLRPDDHLLRST